MAAIDERVTVVESKVEVLQESVEGIPAFARRDQGRNRSGLIATWTRQRGPSSAPESLGRCGYVGCRRSLSTVGLGSSVATTRLIRDTDLALGAAVLPSR